MAPSKTAIAPQDTAASVGTAEHAKHVFDLMAGANLFARKGRKATLRRWFSWVESLTDFLPRWHATLLALTYMGVKTGMYCQHDVPMVAWLRGGLAELDQGDGEGEQEGEVNEQQTKLRKKFRSTLLLCSRLLADSMRQRRCVLMSMALRPFFIAHSKELKGIRGDTGCVQYALGFHTGSYRLVYQKVFKLLRDQKLLRKLGFRLGDTVHQAPASAPRGGTGSASGSRGSGGSSSSSASVAQRELELDMSAEATLCADAFKLCVELVRYRALSMSHWQLCLPNVFVGLLSKSKELRTSTLARLAKMWHAMEDAEKKRHTSIAVAQLFEAAHWCFVGACHRYAPSSRCLPRKGERERRSA